MRQITPLMRFVHIFFSLSFSFSFSSFSSSSSRPPPSDNPFLCLLFNWVTGPYLSTLHRNSMISLRSELANCARCFQRDTLMFFLITLMYLYIYIYFFQITSFSTSSSSSSVERGNGRNANAWPECWPTKEKWRYGDGLFHVRPPSLLG